MSADGPVVLDHGWTDHLCTCEPTAAFIFTSRQHYGRDRSRDAQMHAISLVPPGGDFTGRAVLAAATTRNAVLRFCPVFQVKIDQQE